MLCFKKYLLLFLITGILLIFICLLRDILIPFFLAVSIAYLIYPIVTFFERKNFSRTLAIIIVYMCLVVVVIFLVFGVIPTVYKEINELIVELPVVFADIEKTVNNLNTFFYKVSIPEGMKKILLEGVLRAEAKLVNTLKSIISFAWSSITYFPLFVLTPFLTFYMLHDAEKFAVKFIRLFPEKNHVKINAFIYDLNKTLMHYVRGQITVGLLVGGLTALGLFLIGMPLALFIGVFASFAELIPFFGPFITGTITLFFALAISKKMAIIALIELIVIQQLEANFISPKILGESVGMHPLVIIFLILVGGKYFGVAGMFFIVPIFAVLQIFFRHAVPFLQSYGSD